MSNADNMDLPEKALTLKQAAEVVGCHYQTIFAKRYELGFRLPGGKQWRIWPSTLANLGKETQRKSKMMILGEAQCQSTKEKDLAFGGLTVQRQMAEELDDLLKHPTAN